LAQLSLHSPDEAKLEDAVAAYRAALEEFTAEGDPHDREMAQDGLTSASASLQRRRAQ